MLRRRWVLGSPEDSLCFKEGGEAFQRRGQLTWVLKDD